MTEVTIGTDYIKIKGHADRRIVCHAVSAIGEMLAIYYKRRYGLTVLDAPGYLKICDIPQAETGAPLIVAAAVSYTHLTMPTIA